MKINIGLSGDTPEDNGSSGVDHVVKVLSSKGDKTYEVTVRSNGVAYMCTCPGYQYRQTCKHLDMVSDA